MVHFCTFSRTNVIRKLFHGQCCPWRLGRNRDYPRSLTRRPSEAPAPEGGLLSPGLAYYSALTWALAEGSWRGRLRLLGFSEECGCPSQAGCWSRGCLPSHPVQTHAEKEAAG